MPKRKRIPDDESSTANIYAPLNRAVNSSFRICTLLPGCDNAPISCHISQDDWETSASSYEAVSYVWGDLKSTKTINLNGKPFHVGTNLESLLRHLRSRGRGRAKEKRLWVDAICINQADLDERGHEVQKMSHIYRNASKVVVWLGEPHSGSDMAFDFVNNHLTPCLQAVGYSCTDEQINAAKSSFWDQWDEGKDAETLEAIDHLILQKYAESWSALARLLLRPWWTRAWTVQELISAREVSVHCGSSSMAWPLMEMTVQLMLRNVDIEHLFPKRAQNKLHDAIEDAHAFAYERYHRVLGGYGPESFPQLMQVTRDRKCQDPRDKVFSILSLLEIESADYPFQPKYTEPVHTAYRRAVQAHIQSSKSLHILSSCYRSSNRMPGDLPSWVPSWEYSVDVSYLGGYSAKDEEFAYAASGVSLADVDFSLDQNMMVVTGVVVDTIKDNQLQGSGGEFDYLYTSAKEEPWTSWNIHEILQRLEDEPLIMRYDRETMVEATLKTLIADRHPETGKRRTPLKLRRIKQHLCPRAEDLEAFLSHVEMYTQGRTLILSKDGYLGLAPLASAIGDKICVIYGCHAPVILRPSHGNPEKYTLIGDAYVHGLMDGEALRLVEELPERLTTLKIG